MPSQAPGAVSCRGFRASDSSVRRSELLDHAEGPPACFVVVSGEVVFEGYKHGPGVCLGNGQTEVDATVYAPIPDLTAFLR